MTLGEYDGDWHTEQKDTTFLRIYEILVESREPFANHVKFGRQWALFHSSKKWKTFRLIQDENVA